MELGPIASWVAVVPALISAGVASYQARKSRRSAQDATEALGAALRPIFAFGWNRREANGSGLISIDASNMAAFDAVDVEIWVAVDGGGVLGTSSALRLKGHVPGTLNGGESLVVPDVMRAEDVGAEQIFVITARFYDERQIQQWEQRGRITISGDPNQQQPHVEARKYDQGMPVKYGRKTNT